MGNIYIGNGGIARKSSKIYVGVGGIARQAQKIYIGDVNGKAREVFSSFDPFIWSGDLLLQAGQAVTIANIDSNRIQEAINNGCNSIYAYAYELRGQSQSMGYFSGKITFDKVGGSGGYDYTYFPTSPMHFSLNNVESINIIFANISSDFTSKGTGTFYFEKADNPVDPFW